MQARRRRSSLRHLIVRSSVVTLAAAWVLVTPGCRSSTPEESTPDAGAVRPPRSGVELRAIVNDLVKQMGEDAYAHTSMDPIVEELGRAAALGDPDAKSLRGLVIAKRRLAKKATSMERTPSVSRVDHGIRRMKGKAPKEPMGVQAAEAIGLDASRAELIAAYGNCLVRQTWFRARTIRDMTKEIFQVTPECRDRLTPRVFTVGAEKVISVRHGNVDTLMKAGSDDGEPVD